MSRIIADLEGGRQYASGQKLSATGDGAQTASELISLTMKKPPGREERLIKNEQRGRCFKRQTHGKSPTLTVQIFKAIEE